MVDHRPGQVTGHAQAAVPMSLLQNTRASNVRRPSQVAARATAAREAAATTVVAKEVAAKGVVDRATGRVPRAAPTYSHPSRRASSAELRREEGRLHHPRAVARYTIRIGSSAAEAAARPRMKTLGISARCVVRCAHPRARPHVLGRILALARKTVERSRAAAASRNGSVPPCAAHVTTFVCDETVQAYATTMAPSHGPPHIHITANSATNHPTLVHRPSLERSRRLAFSSRLQSSSVPTPLQHNLQCVVRL